MVDWSIGATLNGWADALTSPFGIVLLIALSFYIFLRVTGRINWKGGSNNKSGSVGKQRADYKIR